MSSEGSREIEAARKRLAAAKTQSSIASTNMTSAKSMLEIAKKNLENVELQVQGADKEVKEAQKMLADAEKRWEVIDIDQQEPEPTVINEGSKKRRKVSLSPLHQAINNTSAADRASVSIASASQTNYTAAVTNNSTRRAMNNTGEAQSASATTLSPNSFDQIDVEGCGTSRVNGRYSRQVDVMHEGASVYIKRGVMDYAIYRGISLSDPTERWHIALWIKGRPSLSFYKSPNNVERPPEKGWIKSHGMGPAPTCRLVNTDVSIATSATAGGSSVESSSNSSSGATAFSLSNNGPSNDEVQIVVEECGDPEINGIYDRETAQDGSPAYTMKGTWKGQQVTFAIFQEPSTSDNRKCMWYIGRSKDTDGDYTNKNLTLFKTSCEVRNEIIPPEGYDGFWTVAGRTRGGVYPAPKCRVRNNTANNVEQITIEGCGVVDVNGIYTRKAKQSDNAPEYTKKGMWKGSPGVFDIRRGEEYGSSWYIGFAADDDCDNPIWRDPIQCFPTFYTAPSGENAWMPPKDEWEVGRRHDGVQPAPKLTWSD